MIPYIIFIIIVFLLLCYVKKDKKYRMIDFIIIVLLICFSGLRYGIGTDYTLYENIYLNMDTIPISLFRTGIGYYFFSHLLYNIVPNTAVVLFFIISALTNIYIYKFCKENSINPGLSIFIYISLGFYTTSFNVFRQMLSVALVLYSSNFLNTKKYIRYITFSILAISIHASSIFIIAIIYFFKKIWKKAINAKVLLIIGIIGVVSYSFVYTFLINNISFISIYEDNSKYIPGLGTYMQIIVYGFIFILINFKKKNIVNENSQYVEYINLFSISFIIMLFGIKNILFMRMANYLNIYIILLIPILYNIYNLKEKKIEKICFYTFCIIYFFIFIYSFGGVVPYQTIFMQIN